MSTAKEVVLSAVSELFGDKDVAAIDRWVAADYIQHNAALPDGRQGLVALMGDLGEDFGYERHRVICDANIVALHGTYHGFGPQPVAAFDIFRVEEGMLVEHWDALQPKAETTVSGRSETDGPSEVTDRDRTDANRELVTNLVQQFFIEGRGEIADYISAVQYHQHNPYIGDGLAGLAAGLAAFAAQGRNMAYATLHQTVAEGNFVLAVSEGTLGTTPTAFYDLFRVADGKIVEHWDITADVPDADQMLHDNGLF